MIPRVAVLLSLLLGAMPTLGLDITGVVINKSEKPVALASICVKNHPSRCVQSDVQGNFHITDGAGVEFSAPKTPVTLELTGGRMALTLPAAAAARIDWHDAAGRSLAPALSTRLAAGRNVLELPALPRDGLHFIRVSMPGFTATWKAVLLEPAGNGRPAPASPRQGLAALSKASALSTELLVTKANYRPEIYLPGSEAETDAVILLTAVSDSGFKYTSVFKAKNLALDRAKGEWITETKVDTCQGVTAVSTTVRDTSRFAIRGGKLLQWFDGQCVGEVLTGGGADVAGTWTFSESDVFLPQDLRPASCKDTIPSSSVPETVKGTLVMTEADQTLEFTVETCPSDIYLPLIGMFLLTDTTVELATNTCRNLTFKNGAGEQAALSFEKRGDSLASTFTFQATTCKGVEMMRQGEGVALDCSGNDPAFDFLDCIAGTGFFGDIPPGAGPLTLAKKSSALATPYARLPMTMVPGRTIRPATGRTSIFSSNGRNHSRTWR